MARRAASRVVAATLNALEMRSLLAPVLLTALITCRPGKSAQGDSMTVGAAARSAVTDPREPERRRMVDRQIRARGISDPSVLAAMSRVPRHRFVPSTYQDEAYDDHPLPIGLDQTISQPYIVAYMTEAADIAPHEKVLEIGTGSGYQAAILAEIAREVYSVELLAELAERARQVLHALGYANVQVRTGDGYAGWKEHAPFDAIVVTAAPPQVPPALVEQLAVGGRLVIPVGDREQEMLVITKTAKGVTQRRTMAVRFVPLVRPDTQRR